MLRRITQCHPERSEAESKDLIFFIASLINMTKSDAENNLMLYLNQILRFTQDDTGKCFEDLHNVILSGAQRSRRIFDLYQQKKILRFTQDDTGNASKIYIMSSRSGAKRSRRILRSVLVSKKIMSLYSG